MTTNATTPIEIYIPSEAALLGFVLAIVIGITGIAGNLVTIAALMRYSARLNSHATTRFVINLALIDLLFCSIVLPITSGRYLTRRWPFGHLLCRLYPLIYYGTVASSLMLITVITINRLVLIAFNSLYNRIYSTRNVYLMVAFCWLFSYGMMAVPFFGLWGHFGLHEPTFSCTILRDDQGRSPKKFLFTLGFLLPMSVIVICYTIIFIHVQRQNRNSKNQFRTSKRDLRLTLLISVVFGTFLLCFLPLFVGNVFIPDDRYPYFHVLAAVCAWLNSTINPFIYFAMNPRYRNAFKKLFRIESSYMVANGDLSQTRSSDRLKWTSKRPQPSPTG